MSDNPEKCADYLKITRLVIDVGTDLARRVFYHFKPKPDVSRFFQSTTILDEILTLKRKHVLKPFQFDILVTEPNPDNFDISLLIILLTNLFKFTVENPKNGWSKDIDEDDTSLGADLMRLQSIRNFIVGHRPSARLSREDFEKLWKDTEDVLLRLAEFLGDEEKNKFQTEIELYKNAKLDDNGKLEEYYLDMLQRWHEEGKNALTDLQNKVEYFLKRTEEFQVFFKNVPERYWRYILLLYEGGMTVMAALLKHLLISQGTDLESILNEKLGVLMASPSVADHIIVDGEIQTNIATWGLKTLSNVIQIVFSSELDSMSASALGDIKKAADNFAETALDSLDSEKFRTHWAHISYSINTLAIGLDKTTQLECFRLIRKLDLDEIDEEAAKTYVSQLQHDCHPFRGLIDMYLETREQLKQTVELMIKEGVCFSKDHVVELKMMTFGEPEDKKKLAEDILFTVWNEAVAMTGKSGDFPEVKAAVEDILQVIRGIKGVHISTPERHCIILKIYCKTYSSVLEVLALLDENCLYWEHIGSCLSAVIQEQIIVTGFITVECMQLIANMQESEQKPGNTAVTVDLNCSSVLAVQNLQVFLENKSAFTKIATTLSEKVEGRISVDITRNRTGFDEVFNDSSGALSAETLGKIGFASSGNKISEILKDSSNMGHFRTTLNELDHIKKDTLMMKLMMWRKKGDIIRRERQSSLHQMFLHEKNKHSFSFSELDIASCVNEMSEKAEIPDELDKLDNFPYTDPKRETNLHKRVSSEKNNPLSLKPELDLVSKPRMAYFYQIVYEIFGLPLQEKWDRVLSFHLPSSFSSSSFSSFSSSSSSFSRSVSSLNDLELLNEMERDCSRERGDFSIDSSISFLTSNDIDANFWQKNISNTASSSSFSSIG